MGNLWTPWRLAYITAAEKPAGCIFCDALGAADDAANLVVHRGALAFAMLNRYPYNNGHVMIAPHAHAARLAEAAPEALAEMMAIATRCEVVLQESYRPEGFNLGLNLGRSAGAGVLGHLHLHVVPRWGGDTNYMAVVSDTRVIPERLEDTYARLAGRLG